MNKSELKKLHSGDESGDSITVSFSSSEDTQEVTLKFKSTIPMSALDFLLALVDWMQGFAAELYNTEKEKSN